MLTIKQLADYVGVTVRAVRHYHRIGLLDEPERTASGYRDYGAEDVIALQRIKVLADAGVPLARVRDLMDADPATLARAAKEIDASLRDRVRELRETRRRLATLASGDDPFLEPRVAALHERLAELGISQTTLKHNREGWILVQAVYPDILDEWLDWQEQALADPAYLDIYVTTDQVRLWDADDPRIEDVAQRTWAWINASAQVSDETWGEANSLAFQLVNGYDAGYTPGWRRLTDRIQQLAREGGYHVPQ